MPTDSPTIEGLRRQVQSLRSLGAGNPRVHPNGFIQLDLDSDAESWHESHQRGHSGGTTRLHIWQPPGHELPHQATVNEIHDHVFSMRSTVVRGILMQQLYWFVVGSVGEPTHEIYRALYEKKSDSRLAATGIMGRLKLAEGYPVGSGEVYVQEQFTLHDSQPIGEGPVVTVMQKMTVYAGEATVICRIDAPPDNSYDRASAAPADFLWSAIEASLI